MKLETIDPIAEAAQQASRSIARQHDGIVMALVRERLGNPDIELQDLHGRLQGFDYLPHLERDGYREWLLDGRPLVRFWPPEISWAGNVMTVNQRYQVHP